MFSSIEYNYISKGCWPKKKGIDAKDWKHKDMKQWHNTSIFWQMDFNLSNRLLVLKKQDIICLLIQISRKQRLNKGNSSERVFLVHLRLPSFPYTILKQNF